MRTKILLLVFTVFFLLMGIGYSQDDNIISKPTINIEGVWNAEPMGGKYYIRQIGNEVFWLGEDDEMNPTWSNIAYGIINGDVITLTWVDVPKGSIMQSGKLVVKIESEKKMYLESQTGEYFGTNLWTRE